MSESLKADLLFSYTLSPEGFYDGSAIYQGEPEVLLGDRAEWVRFVVRMIRCSVPGTAVAFVLKRADGTPYHYRFDQRTVDKIRSDELSVEDLLL